MMIKWKLMLNLKIIIIIEFLQSSQPSKRWISVLINRFKSHGQIEIKINRQLNIHFIIKILMVSIASLSLELL
ncbi:hypothetical protein BpHYR1_006797 [Brachionus plicatilis]|uniref:Uncharacterized protein n=1 Tax=Brachionus plicatilis TaxID=10195 RepID=A0A3M7SA35_BRAPC|nr:hypothetical protein BpHYR1_006797 [Brachionus plicatilis]